MTIHDELAQLNLTDLQFAFHNLNAHELIEHAIMNDEGKLTQDGAFVALTGKHTGRAPNDRFIVKEAATEGDIHWGKVNVAFDEAQFDALYAKLTAYFAGRNAYIQDCFAGATPENRLQVRVITEKAWHNLFAYNMFVRPTDDERATFTPDYTVIQAPDFHADPATDGTNSEAFVILHLTKKLVIISGTHYAGEIKKSIFSILNYLLPKQGIMTMHCSANKGDDGETALFFGLSGTGKTTLSSDAARALIGDDEHAWYDGGIFNIEGGCYAKVIRLSAQGEPEIYSTTKRYGTILENVVMDETTRAINLDDAQYTQNTRASYPIDYIPNALERGTGDHPKHIIFLTCDAFGVMPPVSKLTSEQAAYHFLNGYTAKVAGTEGGVTEPQATFSACFGEPFMPLNPALYADLLAQKIETHGATVWLVNTGWIGGGHGVGERISLAYTRAIINAILDGQLAQIETRQEPYFDLHVPVACPNVPDDLLNPVQMWPDKAAYEREAQALAERFEKNYKRYQVLVNGD